MYIIKSRETTNFLKKTKRIWENDELLRNGKSILKKGISEIKNEMGELKKKDQTDEDRSTVRYKKSEGIMQAWYRDSESWKT